MTDGGVITWEAVHFVVQPEWDGESHIAAG